MYIQIDLPLSKVYTYIHIYIYIAYDTIYQHEIGAFDHWPARHGWTNEYLRSKIGKSVVTVAGKNFEH